MQTDIVSHNGQLERSGSMPTVERRRRKLPEIPKNKSKKKENTPETVGKYIES